MDNLTHRKVQVVIVGGEGLNKLLLLQTNKDRDYHWQNVTGSVDEGETYYSAAIRELKEESGLSANLVELNLEFNFTDRWQRKVTEKVFLAQVAEETQVIISSEEHQDYKWILLNNVTRESFGFESNWESFTAARDWLEDNR